MTEVQHKAYFSHQNGYNHSRYNDERERLATFQDAPLDQKMKEDFARVGFYYSKVDNQLLCSFCHIQIKLIYIGDESAVQLHLQRNSSCPLIRRQNTRNIPINESTLNSVLPQPFKDVCGTGPEITLKYPKFRFKEVRRETFENFPKNTGMNVDDLVESGLFFLGKEDKCVCFSCGTGLMGWEPNDSPFEEHARWTEDCDYLTLIKGKNYITEIKAKYSDD